MIPLFNIENIDDYPTNELLPLKCEHCGDTFHNVKKEVKKVLNNHPAVKLKYCSIQCRHNSRVNKFNITCANCDTPINKNPKELRKSISGNLFCSQSCAATYNNTHKTKGTRISKLELYLQKKLSESYPSLEILYNNKDIINSELDIYIPSLKLAFELNGIFHYEPIFGKEKLSQIQNNDNRKFQACLEHEIELCIIDTSQQKYFKEKSSLKYLNIITNIISKNM